MGYPYEDLDDSQFERLVVQCMRLLFGDGVESFATGPDGGRDARFRGVAERYPSKAGPWTGTTVGQAKHTNAINAHISDSDFSSTADSSVISEEIKRVQLLVAAREINNYIMFTNRRVGGIAGPALINRVADECGMPRAQVALAGVEYIDDLLHQHPELVRLARIDPLDGPLIVSSYNLAEVILAIAEALAAVNPVVDAPLVDRVSFEEKNRSNEMSPEFAKYLSRLYLNLTHQIEGFLAAPGNIEVLRRYEGAVEDFQVKIIAHRKTYQSFDHVFNYLVDLLIKRDGVLSKNRRLTRAMVFYMYWHCDIGETPDALAK